MDSLASSSVAYLGGRGRVGFRQAHAVVLPELLGLEEAELLAVNLEVGRVVVTVLGVAPGLRGFRARMRRLPEFDWASVERLEVYARALGQAQAVYAASGEGSGGVVELVTEARELKGVLVSDARALARRGLVDLGKLGATGRGRPSTRRLAFELMAVSGLLRRHWGRVEGRSAVALVELERAELLAERLLVAIARRGRARTAREEARAMLQRAFTLCVRAYAEARRGLLFLCGSQAEADAVAPSLYASRRAPRG